MHRNEKCYFNDNNKSVYCPRIKKLYTLPETNKKKLKKKFKTEALISAISIKWYCQWLFWDVVFDISMFFSDLDLVSRGIFQRPLLQFVYSSIGISQ